MLNKRSEDAIFTGLASTKSKYIHKFQREEDLFITLFIVYSHIYTYLPKFVNILLYAEANAASCVVNVCKLALIVNSKNDY